MTRRRDEGLPTPKRRLMRARKMMKTQPMAKPPKGVVGFNRGRRQR